MTLEDAERLFGRSRLRPRLGRRTDADAWPSEDQTVANLPAWAPVVAAAAAGLAVGLMVLSAGRATRHVIAALPGDWLQQLGAEDRAIEQLLDAGEATPAAQPNRRAAILVRLAYALVRAGLKKEWAVYPALDDAAGNGEARALAAAQHEIKTRVFGLAALARDGADWAKAWSALAKRVREQANDEARVLPALRARLSAHDNARLTRLVQREGARVG